MKLEDTGLGVKRGDILSPPPENSGFEEMYVVGTNYGE
jgi:hypothetical protein